MKTDYLKDIKDADGEEVEKDWHICADINAETITKKDDGYILKYDGFKFILIPQLKLKLLF